MRLNKLTSDFLQYLIRHEIGAGERVPALTDLSQALSLSVGKLREQLEVARHLQLVSVRPRTGIRREAFDFEPAVSTSLLFSLATQEARFAQFSAVRQALERSFWLEATGQLRESDLVRLEAIVARAWEKLRGDPVHIPTTEHRDLHLTIFHRLDNPFVQGLLRAYWEAYEASELTRFVSYRYWVEVWTYHERIVAALRAGERAAGRQLLIEHFALLSELPTAVRDNGLPGGPATAGRDGRRGDR